jgi:hypothetical protein
MDDALQAQLRAACSASVFVWLNLFGWTFRPKIVNPDGTERSTKGAEAHYPFITWKIQDEGLTAILEAIETGADLGFDKSRDMGASWIILSALHWLWQFRPAFSAMELSRSEEYVDQKGNMKTLFEKHRYLLKWQPAWLRPRRIEDYYMRLVNHDNGSIIWGESANQNAGRGGRGNVALLDEFGAVENGEAQDRATADAFPCRIVNSTPQVGSYYNQWIDSGRLRVVKMPWWRHPEKGKGAHQVFDERGRPKWVSPWYFAQAKRRDKKHMAQEVDMEHGLAGATFFDHDELNRHREAHVREPMTTGSLVALGDYGPERVRGIIRNRDHKSFKFVDGGGFWRFWIPLVDGRPPQHLSYCFGVDISNGANGSNSVITAYARETNEIVAKFWSATILPEQLAVEAASAGIWFGGVYSAAFIVFENNGPGGAFGRKLVREIGYTKVYYQRTENTKSETVTPRWGWHSNNDRKQVLLARYREALATDQVINHCAESIAEARDYIYDENAKLIPGKLKVETGGGQALHGDHVIADALCVLGRDELPKFVEKAMKAPAGSFAWRRDRARKERRRTANDADNWGR